MNGMPDMMFVIDVRKEDIAVKEANRLNIPIVAVVDTNCSPEGINLVIPGNDDALRAIRLFASRIADAIIEGRQVGTEGVSTAAAPAEAAEETPAEPVVESTISIPKEYLTEDEVAEIESADIPEEEEEDVELEVPAEATSEETPAGSEGSPEEPATDAAPEAAPEAQAPTAEAAAETAEPQTEESNEAAAS
jgi:small subunit ribosomal protein S2